MDMAAERRVITVALGDRSYPVIVGPGVIDVAGKQVRRDGYEGKVVVVTQRAPKRFFGPRLTSSLRNAGLEPRFVLLPEGEKAKTWDRVSMLHDFFMGEGLDRWSPVIALGGGVVGDTAGFAAGTYMRGVPFYQVPTTLIAQVDSSVGGKAAVNHPRGKNVIGIFYQPKGVLIDTDTLATLPRRDLVAGLAEVIRYAAIADVRFYGWLERNLDGVLARDPARLTPMIRRCCALKAGLVEKDERDLTDIRALLNYGHTVGHAIEAAAGYGKWRHGEAVAAGMAVAARLAGIMGVLGSRSVARQISLLKRAGLPVTLRGVSTVKVLNCLKLDKKFRQGRMRFVLTEALGHATVFDGIDMGLVQRALTVP
jgi:3-dehydroquinate synthase